MSKLSFENFKFALFKTGRYLSTIQGRNDITDINKPWWRYLE